MTDVCEVKCGACNVPLNGPVDAMAEDRFSCPICGAGDTRENVLREAGEYCQERAAIHLQEQARAVASTSKWIKFEGQPIPKRTYRFVVDIDQHFGQGA